MPFVELSTKRANRPSASAEPRVDPSGCFSYRMVLGARDVPVGVELALEGAHQGDLRRIELPPDLGFETSAWRPAPSGFSGRQRLENYRLRLSGNGLQPGYAASVLFQVEVLRVRPAPKAAAEPGAGEPS